MFGPIGYSRGWRVPCLYLVLKLTHSPIEAGLILGDCIPMLAVTYIFKCVRHTEHRAIHVN